MQPIIDRQTNVETKKAGLPEGISAHEILGHSLAWLQPGNVNCSAFNAIQVDNLYLRSIGINNLYRTKHEGVPFSVSKVELIPDYLKYS